MSEASLPAGGPAVVCDGAVIRYGRTLAVDRLSFSAERGQVVALLGPNGAGKTSTVEALEGYRRLDGGEVRVLGLDPRRDRAALAARLGVMLQRGGLYPSLSPDRAVRLFAGYYPRPEDPDRLIGALGLAGMPGTPRGDGCPVVSSSGWRWPWPWWGDPRSCSSTSPPPASIPRAAWPCATSSAPNGISAAAWSSPPTS